MHLAAALLVLGAGEALADDAPYTFPRSDVAVTYRVAGNLTQTLRVSAASGRERVDAPGGGLSMVTDTVAGTVLVLDNAGHRYEELPAPPGTVDARGRRAQGAYRKRGAAVVAGLACTEWDTTDGAGRPVTLCITADGLMLRIRNSEATLAEAIDVQRAPQEASLFAVPPGWTRTPR